jgi:hypothetical protein
MRGKAYRRTAVMCVPCDMSRDDARQGLQTSGRDVRNVRPRDGRENTTTRSFWHIGRKHPMTNIRTKHRMEKPQRRIHRRNPTDTVKWVPNKNIPAFLGQHSDRAHTATSPAQQRRPGSDLNGHPEITHSSVRCFDWDILVHLSHSIISNY